MADGRKNNKGTKGNKGGRKSKAEELKLIEKLTPYEGKALALLFKKIDENDMAALKMFMEYMYGKPKQQQEIDLDARLEGDIEFKELIKAISGNK